MFHSIYEFVVGPLAWIGWGILVFGTVYRLLYMYNLARTKDASSWAYMSCKYSFRSILAWLIPYNALGWQKNPILTAVTFVFHICLLAVPIFLLGHVVLWEKFFGISWITLPDQIADYMTMIVLACCVFFAVRRILDKDVKFLTSSKDWWTLVVVVAPFLTGLLAYHQIFDYKFMIVLHIVSGLIWIALIPFGRLSHVIFALFSRAYIGSEFGGIRKAKDW